MPRKDRSKNALKHGAFSREVILPGESRKEYKLLLAALEEEWSPEGPTETHLVNHLASLFWRERRLKVYEQAKLDERVRAVKRNNEKGYWRRVLKSFASRFAAATTFKEVENIIASKRFPLHEITCFVPQPPPEQEATWGPAIADYLNNMEVGKQLHGIDAFKDVVDPVEMEVDILRLDRVYQDIDRTIKRLAQVKGYKQMGLVVRAEVNTSKLIEVSPIKTIESARQHNNENSPELAKEIAKLAKRND